MGDFYVFHVGKSYTLGVSGAHQEWNFFPSFPLSSIHFRDREGLVRGRFIKMNRLLYISPFSGSGDTYISASPADCLAVLRNQTAMMGPIFSWDQS